MGQDKDTQIHTQNRTHTDKIDMSANHELTCTQDD